MKRADIVHLLIDAAVCVLCILTFVETRGLGVALVQNRDWRATTTRQIEDTARRIDAIEQLVESVRSKHGGGDGR